MTEEDKTIRITQCMSCNKNQLVEFPMCVVCQKPISFLTSEDEEVCPEGKW